MIVTRPEELTAAWAAAVLDQPVRQVEVEPVGTGQIGTCYRLTVLGDSGSRTVMVKLPAADPAMRDLLAGVYRGELTFYSQLAHTVAVRVPHCHLARMEDDGRRFTLVMADLAPAQQGDQLTGCTPAQALDAVVNLAGLHGPRWCDPSLLQVEGLSLNGPEDAAMMAEFFGGAVDIFCTELAGLLADGTEQTLRELGGVLETWALARSERFALVHGDYRLDNLLFPPDGAPGVVAVDWQTLSLALPARDLAYFTGTSLLTPDRRAHEEDLVAAYHAALLDHGVAGYSLAQCWDDYRFSMIQGPLVSVFGMAYGTRTPRGDRMFAAMVDRSCTAIRDLDTLALITR